jgi:hypothetical protein
MGRGERKYQKEILNRRRIDCVMTASESNLLLSIIDDNGIEWWEFRKERVKVHGTTRRKHVIVKAFVTNQLHKLTPWSGVLLGKLTITQLVKNSKVYYPVNKSEPLVRILNQMYPGHTFSSYYPKIILILSSHLCLGLQCDFFASSLPAKILYKFLISHACYMPRQ